MRFSHTEALYGPLSAIYFSVKCAFHGGVPFFVALGSELRTAGFLRSLFSFISFVFPASFAIPDFPPLKPNFKYLAKSTLTPPTLPALNEVEEASKPLPINQSSSEIETHFLLRRRLNSQSVGQLGVKLLDVLVEDEAAVGTAKAEGV